MKAVLLGLGSNRSFNGFSPSELLSRAVSELKEIVINPVISSVYRTKAMYVTDQEDFFNMACFGYVDDNEDPYGFLEKIHKIEEKYGRDRSKEIRFGPRSLDIDIEHFGDFTSDDPVLTVPHPRLKERAFVLVPALEILPESAENQLRMEYRNALEKLDQSEVQLLFRL